MHPKRVNEATKMSHRLVAAGLCLSMQLGRQREGGKRKAVFVKSERVKEKGQTFFRQHKMLPCRPFGSHKSTLYSGENPSRTCVPTCVCVCAACESE